MLVKTRNRFDNSTKINDELFLLTKELEKDFITELFGNKIKDNQKNGIITDLGLSPKHSHYAVFYFYPKAVIRACLYFAF